MVKILLSKRLGELRWNQAMLARVTGIRAATINAWYHEDIDRISLEHLAQICNALECDIGDILILEPNRRPPFNSAPTKKV